MLMSEYNYEQDIEVQREEAYEEGRKFGLTEGQKLGRKEGEGVFAKLVQILMEKNRLEDLKKATEDEAYRSELLKEFHIEF